MLSLRWTTLVRLIFLLGHLIFERCVVDVASRAKHQNDICSKEIELRVRNMVTSLGSVVNVIKGGPI